MASAKTEKYSADTEEYSAETEEYSAEELSQSQNQSDSTYSPESESLSDFSEVKEKVIFLVQAKCVCCPWALQWESSVHYSYYILFSPCTMLYLAGHRGEFSGSEIFHGLLFHKNIRMPTPQNLGTPPPPL